MRLALILFVFVLSALSSVQAMTEQEWQCQQAFEQHEYIKQWLRNKPTNRDLFAQCMQRTGNNAGTCNAEQAGRLLGQGISGGGEEREARQALAETEAYIRRYCLE